MSKMDSSLKATYPQRAGRWLRKRRAGGFTLLEVMIVLVIIGIIMKIAIPSYKDNVRKARRTIAKTGLLDMAARQEKFYSLQNVYSQTNTDLGYAALPFSLTDSSGGTVYTLAVTANAASGATPASYTATATPTGAQTGDPCGTFQITSVGVQTAALTSGCW